PINRGQISPRSPSEQSFAQRAHIFSNLKLPGWSEEASDWSLVQRAPPRPASTLFPDFLKLANHGN
ncbi:hypothetical protein A2U01_0097851, partial [Trifolium medium]|nr:hypothetical protein [Trifolium medium]